MLISRNFGYIAVVLFLIPAIAISQSQKTNKGDEQTNKDSANPNLEESPESADDLDSLAQQHYQREEYAEAALLFGRALVIYENALGPDHPNVALTLNNLAGLYSDQGRYAEAEPLLQRALVIFETAFGGEHPGVAMTLNGLARLYNAQRRFGEAEPLYRRALAIYEGAVGPDHPSFATILANLGKLYSDQGRYAEAEPLLQRALGIREKVLGPDHPEVATSLVNLAALFWDQGRYEEAEPLYQRALVIFETAFGDEHHSVAMTLNGLAQVYNTQRRFGEAEPLYRRALAIYEEAVGPDHPSLATILANLGKLYGDQGRYAEAEPLLQRALVIFETAFGGKDPGVATILSNIAALYNVQGRYAEADPLFQRALAIRETVLGPDHPSFATTLNDFASMFLAQGRYEEAEPLFLRALALKETALGGEHPGVAVILSNLGLTYSRQGRYAEAEALFRRAQAIFETAFGGENPGVAVILSNLGVTYSLQGRYEDALFSIRRSSAIHRARASLVGSALSSGASSELGSVRVRFLRHVEIATNAIVQFPEQRGALTAEAFEVGQLAKSTETSATVSRMGARFAAGDDALALMVRQRQDAVGRWRGVDASLVKAVSELPANRNEAVEAAWRSEIETLDRTILELDAQLARDFPAYAELANPKPVSLVEAQQLLSPDEALVTFLVGPEKTFLWVLRRDKANVHRIDIGRTELAEAVAQLRTGLDPAGVSRIADIPAFDTRAAFKLYEMLFAPAVPLLEDAQHVFVVPDGALQSLPLGVLVTEEPGDDFPGYRQVPWLAQKYALTVLPSVSSLRALRSHAAASEATSPFVGFGDPLLAGHPDAKSGVEIAALFNRGVIVDVDALNTLAALPETADELLAIARSLGAENDSVFVRERATEHRVRTTDLSEFKVVAFATHALVAGEFKGIAEPGLVMSPPSKGTEEDDGFLTASEIATLDLDADLVLLSACNSAAADGTPGAEGLSGLAKAFFYAGSRALVVSHWSVESDAAANLTTGMLENLAENPSDGRAEALRQSMLSLMQEDDAKPYHAHPMFWAGFSLVGEGGLQ